MTVFMSPRTNYDLGRYQTQSSMAWMVVLFLLLGGGTIAWRLSEKEMDHTGSYALCGIAALSVASKNGRRTVGRVMKETFYGTLHSFTGVFGFLDEDGYVGR